MVKVWNQVFSYHLHKIWYGRGKAVLLNKCKFQENWLSKSHTSFCYILEQYLKFTCQRILSVLQTKPGLKQLWWSRGSVLPLSTQGSNPAETVRIFQGKKILSTPSFGGEVKPSVPCRRFAACKRSLNVTWKSTFRQNYRPTFSPTVPPFDARISRVIWTWRCLVVEVGTSKITGGQGSHNKPIGWGASGAYDPGPDDEEETWSYLNESNQQQIISKVV
jgi:hypothetical protein